MTRAVTTTARVGGRQLKQAPAYKHPVWRDAPPENIALEIERLAGEHMGKARIAVELGTSPKVLTRWMNEDPVLAECYERGKARAEHELYMLIVDDARLGTAKLNMSAVYALNNRHAWRMERNEDAGRVNVVINYPATKALENYIDVEPMQAP